MHVLFAPSWYPTTEAPYRGIYFREQAQCLSDAGMQVGVIYPEHQSLRRLSWSALTEKHFQTKWSNEAGIPTLRRYGWNVWNRFPPGQRSRVSHAVDLADRYIERHGVPDVVHAQSGRWAGAAAARIKQRYSIPSVLTEHFSGLLRNSIFWWRWPVIREGYRNADVISSVSSALTDAIADHGLAEASEVIPHPNLAPVRQFQPLSDRQPPPPFRLVTVAQLTSRKNVGDLLEAVALAGTRRSTSQFDVRVRIVGDGPQRSRLERKASDLDLHHHVDFLGQQERSAIRDILRTSHAFVLPSLYETFGVVLLEAMATGLPVVATRCGGPEDLVSPQNGILVPPADPEALSEALLDILECWSSYDSEKIRRQICEEYGPDAFVRRTRSLYRRALGR